MRLFGLIGYPLAHSFSKQYFTKKFEQEEITECLYDLYPLRSINDLPGLIEKNPGLEGLNVTVPYKKQVLKFLNVSHLPDGLNACNCINIINGDLHGYNTDWSAFRQSIRGRLDWYMKSALILGNGGAAEAVSFALNSMNIKANIVSRQSGNGATYTYEQLNEQIIHENKLIINTTPVGQYPNITECPPIPYEFLTWEHLLFDLIYNPFKSQFLQKGEEKNATIMNGEEMLVLQAEESWRIWNQ